VYWSLFFPKHRRVLHRQRCQTCLHRVDGEWQDPTDEPSEYLCLLESKTKKLELIGNRPGGKFPKEREKYQLLTEEVIHGSGAFSAALFWGEEKMK